MIIGPNCVLTSNVHEYDPEVGHFGNVNKNKPLRIGLGSWLAAGVVVGGGVIIGNHNLVCANAVVTKSTQPYSIVCCWFDY